MLWFRMYFMNGLQCNSPIVEAFEHGATRLEHSGDDEKYYFMGNMYLIKDTLYIQYFKNGRIHRSDGPALIYRYGTKYWYNNGVNYRIDTLDCSSWYDKTSKLHRKDGPAREWRDGTKIWCCRGKLYRRDGPAVVHSNGIKIWYCLRYQELVHREDGPAIEFENGDKIWVRRGMLYRKNGPAIEGVGGYKGWYRKGKCIREENVNSRTKRFKRIHDIVDDLYVRLKFN